MTSESIAKKLQAALTAKGYKWFTGKYDLNIVAIRSPARQAGRFDDLLCCAYQDSTGGWRVHLWPCTTDPSSYYLKKPINPAGCLIVAPGQYRGAYRPGLHRGRPALTQIKPVRGWRDTDGDTSLDWLPGDPGTPGLYAANIHDTTAKGGVADIARAASAGCTVLPVRDDLRALLSLVGRQDRAGHGSAVTYTLIDSSDLG